MPEKECPREPWLRVLDYLGKRHWSAQEIAELLWMAQRIAADAPEPDPSLDSPQYLLEKSAQLGPVDLGQHEAQQLSGSRSPSALLNSAIEDHPSLTKPTPEREVPLMPAFGPESSFPVEPMGATGPPVSTGCGRHGGADRSGSHRKRLLAAGADGPAAGMAIP